MPTVNEIDIDVPHVPAEEISLQWSNLCKDLREAIDTDAKEKKRCIVLHYKIFDENRKRLEEKGFWTTNHIVSCPIRHRHTYVTAVSWA